MPAAEAASAKPAWHLTAPPADGNSTIVAPPLVTEPVHNNRLFLGREAGDDPDNHLREWWQRKAEQGGFDLHAVTELCIDIIASRLFESPFMCACRLDDERRKPVPPQKPTPRPTPAVVVVLHTVRERGTEALKEASNVERLRQCDAAARAEINKRIAKMGAGNG